MDVTSRVYLYPMSGAGAMHVVHSRYEHRLYFCVTCAFSWSVMTPADSGVG